MLIWMPTLKPRAYQKPSYPTSRRSKVHNYSWPYKIVRQRSSRRSRLLVSVRVGILQLGHPVLVRYARDQGILYRTRWRPIHDVHRHYQRHPVSGEQAGGGLKWRGGGTRGGKRERSLIMPILYSYFTICITLSHHILEEIDFIIDHIYFPHTFPFMRDVRLDKQNEKFSFPL